MFLLSISGSYVERDRLLSALPPAIEGAVTADFVGENNTVVEVRNFLMSNRIVLFFAPFYFLLVPTRPICKSGSDFPCLVNFTLEKNVKELSGYKNNSCSLHFL